MTGTSSRRQFHHRDQHGVQTTTLIRRPCDQFEYHLLRNRLKTVQLCTIKSGERGRIGRSIIEISAYTHNFVVEGLTESIQQLVPRNITRERGCLGLTKQLTGDRTEFFFFEDAQSDVCRR